MANGELEIEGIEKVDALVIKLKDDMLTLVEAFTSVITTNEKLNDSEVKNEKTLKDIIEKRNTQTKAETESAKAKKEIAVKTDEMIVAESRAKKLKQDHLTIMKAEAIMSDKNAGLIEKQKAELNKLRVEKERLIATDKNYEKELKRIIDRQNELARGLTKTNYSTQKAYWAFGQQLSPAMASAAEQAKNFTAKLGGLNPFVLGLVGTFAAGIGAVVTFFKSSERGAEMLERKMAGLKAAFGVLADEVILAGEKIVENADKDQKKVGMWTKVFAVLGGAIPGLTAKFMSLGMEMDIVSKEAEIATGMMQDLEDLEREMIVPRSKTNKQIAEAKLLYQDETKSIEVRYDALKKSLDLETAMSDTEVKHQEKVIANIEAQIKLKGQRVRDEDLLKLEQAKAKLYDLQTESLLKQRKVQSTLNAAAKELANTFEAQEKIITAWANTEFEKLKLSSDQRIKFNDEISQYFKDKQIEDNEISLENQEYYNNVAKEQRDEKLMSDLEAAGLNLEQIEIAYSEYRQREYDASLGALQNERDIIANSLLDAQTKAIQLAAIDAKISETKLTELEKRKNDEIKKAEETEKRKQEIQSLAVNTYLGFTSAIGAATGQLMMGQEDMARQTIKNAVGAALDGLKALTYIFIAQAIGGSMATIQSIATAGIAGALQAAGLTAAIELAYSAAELGVNSIVDSFAHGTKDAPGGAAILGEGTGIYAGRELVTLPDGTKFLTPDHATLYPDLPKHSVVTPANMVEQELRKSFENSQLSKNDNRFMSDIILRDMNKNLKMLTKKNTAVHIHGMNVGYIDMVNKRYRS